VSDVLADPPRPRRMLARALTRHCPRCGAGHLFRHWLQMVGRCPGCGYPFEREEDSFFGGYLVNLTVTFASLAVFFVWLIARQSANPDASATLPIVVGLLICTVIPLGFYPLSRLLWIVIELVFAPLELREIQDAADAVGVGDHPDSSGGPSVVGGSGPVR
jgi:uncharacterized protein (DUF983 family)